MLVIYLVVVCSISYNFVLSIFMLICMYVFFLTLILINNTNTKCPLTLSRYSYNHIEFITDHRYAESQSKVFLIDIINFNTLTINSVVKNFQLLT